MAPSERCLHAMVCLDDGQIVVFGGLGAADHGLNDVHVLDLLDTVSWRKPEVTGTIPSPRWNCVVWKRKDQMFVFGGRRDDCQVVCSNLWV